MTRRAKTVRKAVKTKAERRENKQSEPFVCLYLTAATDGASVRPSAKNLRGGEKGNELVLRGTNSPVHLSQVNIIKFPSHPINPLHAYMKYKIIAALALTNESVCAH